MWSFGKSRILKGAERVCGTVRDFMAKSVILQGFSNVYPRLESSFRQGRFQNLSDAERHRRVWQYRFRRRCMRATEESLARRLWLWITSYLLQTAMGSFGAFGVLCGGLSCFLWLLSSSPKRSLSELVGALILTVISVPLLHSERSLSRALKESILIGGFLFDFCKIPETRLFYEEEGKRHDLFALFTAILLATLNLWLPAVFLLFALIILLAVLLLFTVPEIGVLTVFFMLPFLNFFTHPTLILLLFTVLTELTWLLKAVTGRRTLRFGLLDLSVLLLALCYFVSGLSGAGGKASFYSGAVYAAGICFWCPVRSLLSQKGWRNRALVGLGISSVFTAFLGIFQYISGKAELKWVDSSRFFDIGGRVVSSFTNPNILAIYLLLTAPFLLAGGLSPERKPLARILSVLGFFAVGVCLTLTWSRGAWLGFMIACLFFFLCYSRMSAGALLLSAFPILSALPHLPHNVINRFSSIASFADSSIRYRFYTWQGVLRMLKEHLFGIGVGSEAFFAVYPKYAVSGTETVMHAHNLPLQVFVSLGLPGGLIFLFFLGLLFLYTVHAISAQTHSERNVFLGAACALIGVLIMGWFDDIWYHSGMLVLFFSVAALMTLFETGEGEVVFYEKT